MYERWSEQDASWLSRAWIRRNSARSVEDMQRTITELESKLKSESSRLKKKYESEQQDLIMQIDNLTRNNADLAKSNKSLAAKLKVNFGCSLHLQNFWS